MLALPAQLPLCLQVSPEHRQARSRVLGQAVHDQPEQQQLSVRALLQAGALMPRAAAASRPEQAACPGWCCCCAASS